MTLMDLLSNAYSIGSEGEEDDDGSRRKPMGPELPRPKRVRMESFVHIPRTTPVYHHSPIPILPTEAPLPGRYISKRERAAMASATVLHSPNPSSFSLTSPVEGTISASALPHDILSKLRNHRKDPVNLSQIPQGASISLNGHTKPVNTIQWCRNHVLAFQLICLHLLEWIILSAYGMCGAESTRGHVC